MVENLKKDPLFCYYQEWHDDCLESARWLRSGQEYEEWMKERNFTAIPPERREGLAQEYEARAALYKKYMGEGAYSAPTAE